MCCLLVSGFLTEITQQIHSLRASGVISSHFARATGSEKRTFRKSAGTLCIAPGERALLFMDFILHRYSISLGSPRMPSELGRPDTGMRRVSACFGGEVSVLRKDPSHRGERWKYVHPRDNTG
jgi:hypothetical protein